MALDTLSSQAVLACKLLREENRLLRKERKLLMYEGLGKMSMNTSNTADSGKLVREMNEQFLLKTIDIKNQSDDLARKNQELQGQLRQLEAN